MKIGIVGVGFVGGAMKKCLEEKNVNVLCYDKYKQYNSFKDISDCDIVFLCLPTPFVEESGYDKSPIYETCDLLNRYGFTGAVVLKSTVEPGTTRRLNKNYDFEIFHNPEFLTARTAYEDFRDQSHIVLGREESSDSFNKLYYFYKKYWPRAEVSVCTTKESESMKLFCNNFYAMKIMIFNEFYELCLENGTSYKKVKELMIKNNWINPMHTEVPGPDGLLGYGGACFIKDTNALLEHTKRKGTLNKVLEATVKERNMLRSDQTNVLKIKGE